MTRKQRAYILMLLHSSLISERNEKLHSEMKHFGISDSEYQKEVRNVESDFLCGIQRINSNQLNNILKQALQNGVDTTNIIRRLEFFEINKDFHENIIQFVQDYVQAEEPVDVGDLDAEFRGVQVASRDNFNTIINQGWTGDWDLNPDNINPKRVQIASMNDDGLFPRGYYLNADIIDIQEIQYIGKIRYRIFIANPEIINTGNRNVKFIAQPVRYIK
ncbi:MAG: hypothetical protein CVT94_18840 [Bacteroidetes bacterium HGW-Bacteroidetes-11]|jgi:hypothetical protein|nr:MAG: hypothetical protein CVT94_18840 [Bacteroidetes bacterium HGW-Bacteroidetes-11]